VATDAAVGELVAEVQAQADAQGRELAVVVLSDHGFFGVHRVFRPKSYLMSPPDGEEPIETVYALESNASLLYVPAHGRERLAPLTDEEHERLVGEVHDRVLAAVDPELHVNPAQGGWRKEQVYHGRYMEKAPDLVFLARKPYYFIYEPGDMEPFGFPKFSFNAHHDMRGILMTRGPMFRTGAIEGDQSLLDIAPTLMYLTGAEVPGYFEGDVLTSLVTKAFLDKHPVRKDDSGPRDVGGDSEKIKAIPYVQ
jgi:predicted AlkP superfamily phosphohydrolase/phosphomutase